MATIMRDSGTIKGNELAASRRQQGIFALIDEGIFALIDVRTPAKFQEVHAVPARNVLPDAHDPAGLPASSATRDKPVEVICLSRSRAATAIELQRIAGHESFMNVEVGAISLGRKSPSRANLVLVSANLQDCSCSPTVFPARGMCWSSAATA